MGCSSGDAEPTSWGQLCQTYRSSWGSGSFCTVNDTGAAPQQRFARSVPTMCPLAETRHPLYATGEPPHNPNMLDGSLQRTNRHGWGDVSLTKQEGLAGVLHRSGREERQGKAPVPCPVAKDGRSSLFGTLAGTEAGGVDSWLGNPLFDPTKGRRALSAPQDPKGRKGLAEVFTLASPGKPDDDAWLGCVGHDPAHGRGKVADPSAQRGRRNLFSVLQPDRPVAEWEGGGGFQQESDAWMGNRAIAPDSGKRGVDPSEVAAAEEHLWGAMFRGGPPPDGCWSDMPRIGKRPIADPVTKTGAINAAHTLRQHDPLPPGTKQPNSDAKGKRITCTPPRSGSVDVYSLLTFKDLSQTDKQHSCQYRWNDASSPSRLKPAEEVPGTRMAGDPGLLDWAPNRVSRFVPFGGLCQERAMNIDTISKIAAITRKGGGTMARSPPKQRTKGPSVRGSAQQQQ